MTFLGIEVGADGARLEVENRIQPGAGPPMHVHHLQEEAITVLGGSIAYRIAGRDVQHAAEGDTVVFPPGQPHRFWNPGDDELRIRGHLKPPLNFEYLLSENFASMREHGGRPGLLEGAYLLDRYRSEFSLHLPGFVTRLLFPTMVRIGRALGRFEKYADAPEPFSEVAKGGRVG